MVGGIAETIEGGRSIAEAIKSGHVRKGLEGGARVATSLGNVGAAAAGMAESGSMLSGASGVASTVGGSVIPGFNVALGGLDIIQGSASTIQALRGRRALTNSIGQVEKEGDAGSAGLADSLRFMHGVQGKVAKRGAINATAGALQVAGGVTTLSGVGAPVGAALGGVGSGIKAGRSIFRDLKQWARNKAADEPESRGGRIARFFRANAARSSKAKAAEMDAHVDRLVGQHKSELVHSALDDLGASPQDLASFKNYANLGPDEQAALKGRLKGLHMKRQGGDQESYAPGEWRKNLFSDDLPAAGTWLTKKARTAGSAIARGAGWLWSKLRGGASAIRDKFRGALPSPGTTRLDEQVEPAA